MVINTNKSITRFLIQQIYKLWGVYDLHEYKNIYLLKKYTSYIVDILCYIKDLHNYKYMYLGNR
jgi:hypothetical protein